MLQYIVHKVCSVGNLFGRCGHNVLLAKSVLPQCYPHLQRKLHLLGMPRHTIHSQCIFPNHPDDGLVDAGRGSVALVDIYHALPGTALLLAS